MQVIEWSVWSVAKLLELSVKTVAYTVSSTVYMVPSIYKWYRKEPTTRDLIVEQNKQIQQLQQSMIDLQKSIEILKNSDN